MSDRNMHVFALFPTNHRVSAIKRQILPKIFTRCSKKVSAIANVRYKSVHYIEIFVWEFDRDSASPIKKVSAITRCTLYSMSAIDRFDCIRSFWI